jgi:hypothetical protein
MNKTNNTPKHKLIIDFYFFDRDWYFEIILSAKNALS